MPVFVVDAIVVLPRGVVISSWVIHPIQQGIAALVLIIEPPSAVLIHSTPTLVWAVGRVEVHAIVELKVILKVSSVGLVGHAVVQGFRLYQEVGEINGV